MGSFMHPLRHPSSAFMSFSTVQVILDSSGHSRQFPGDSVAIPGDAQAMFLQKPPSLREAPTKPPSLREAPLSILCNIRNDHHIHLNQDTHKHSLFILELKTY